VTPSRGQVPAKPAPELQISEQIFSALFRTTGLIRQLMGPFFEGYGTSAAQWVVLRILFEREQAAHAPLRLVDLSHSMAIRQPSLTAVVNKLVMQGLVERVAAAGDRRERQVRLAPKGRRLIEAISPAHLERAHRLLSALNPGEQRRFSRLLDKLWQRLEHTKRDADGPEARRGGSAKKIV
jgi:DNA-binding MarR family transcriptional regulator